MINKTLNLLSYIAESLSFLFLLILILTGTSGCVTYSTKMFTYSKSDIIPVHEWEIVAELIAYWAAKDVNKEELDKQSDYFLEVRTYEAPKIVEKLPLDALHDLKIDSVMISYGSITKTFLGHDSYETNEANKRYFNKENGKFLGRLIVGRDHYKVGEILQDVKEVVVTIHVTTRNVVEGEESFARSFNLKFYKNRSKWPKLLEGK